MRLTRRGLFGLGIGSVLAALVGRQDRYEPGLREYVRARREGETFTSTSGFANVGPYGFYATSTMIASSSGTFEVMFYDTNGGYHKRV